MLPTLKPYKGEPVKYAHHKRDGYRVELKYYAAATGNKILATSRGGHSLDLSHWPWYGDLSQYLIDHRDRILVGELWAPGRPASDVRTAYNARDPSLRWECFAIDNWVPEAPLETWSGHCSDHSIPYIPFEVGVPPLVDLPPNVEGYVLKAAHLQQWYKYKRERTIDLIVCDTKDGNGKYLGLIGALVCKTYEGFIVANVSGMTEKERIELSLDDHLIGKIVEVKYQYVGAKGRLRHPRFIRKRWDKKPDECTTSQDPDLERFYS